MHKSDKIHAHTIMMHSVQALYCNWDCHWDCLRILGLYCNLHLIISRLQFYDILWKYKFESPSLRKLRFQQVYLLETFFCCLSVCYELTSWILYGSICYLGRDVIIFLYVIMCSYYLERGVLFCNNFIYNKRCISLYISIFAY